MQPRMIARSAIRQMLVLCLMSILAGCAAIPNERIKPFGFDYVEPAKVAPPCLVVFAAPGWDLGHQWKAGHGGIRPGEMNFPLIMAGLGIPHGQLSRGPAVGVLPTILELLSQKADKNVDGQILIKKGATARVQSR